VPGEDVGVSTGSSRPSAPRRPAAIGEGPRLPPNGPANVWAGVGARSAGGRPSITPRVPAVPAHRQAGQDGLLARGVVLRHVHRHPRPCTTSTASRRLASLSIEGPKWSSKAGLTRRARPRSSATAGLWAGALTRCRTSRLTGYGSTPTPPVRCDARFRARCRLVSRASPTDGPLRVGALPDPVEFVGRNAMSDGSRVPTGQTIDRPGARGRNGCRKSRTWRFRTTAVGVRSLTCGICPGGVSPPPPVKAAGAGVGY